MAWHGPAWLSLFAWLLGSFGVFGFIGLLVGAEWVIWLGWLGRLVGFALASGGFVLMSVGFRVDLFWLWLDSV